MRDAAIIRPNFRAGTNERGKQKFLESRKFFHLSRTPLYIFLRFVLAFLDILRVYNTLKFFMIS